MSFPWPSPLVPHYTACRVSEPIAIDGNLDKAPWLRACKSPRFVDMVTGRRRLFDTRAAVLWDDSYLYAAYWVEEPLVAAELTERDSPIYTENDVELFVAGRDAYYELELNALGTIYEVLFVWKDAYLRDDYYSADERLSLCAPGAASFQGPGFSHPRGERIGFFEWDMPGLRTAVAVDGMINEPGFRDRGWTAEIAIPWKSLDILAQADGRSVPPKAGDTWRIDFSRFNTYREAPPARDSGAWSWSPHGVWDSHVPELFCHVHFSTDPI